jgi:hypothetical protein
MIECKSRKSSAGRRQYSDIIKNCKIRPRSFQFAGVLVSIPLTEYRRMPKCRHDRLFSVHRQIEAQTFRAHEISNLPRAAAR